MSRQAGLRVGGQAVDLSRPLRIHIVGVGGAGMSAIALVAASMGHTVSGSDLKEARVINLLRAAGVRVDVGHKAGNVAGADALAVSSAIPAGNPEVIEAGRLGIPVFSRADVLSAIAASKRTVAVAGTHGKTTTSSMLALILIEAGWSPSFIIGGELNEVGTGAVWDTGEWLVVEADESDGTFLRLEHEVALVTSVEPDHLGYWGSFGALKEGFAQVLAASGEIKVVCADDPVVAELGDLAGAISYGTAASADYTMCDVALRRSSTSFTVRYRGTQVAHVSLPVPGVHNARNAAGALATSIEMGVAPEPACRALARFAGVARRFEFRGAISGVVFVDDYAHLPSEVRAALATAKLANPARVVCVFQPHRYTRTAELWREMGAALADADVVVVTDVHSAGEAPIPGISGKLIADAASEGRAPGDVLYVSTREELMSVLGSLLAPGDLCLTLGAGDLTHLPDDLLQMLGTR